MCSSHRGLRERVCISLFFFFKQKTAYEMRISDWSSDVCSSDLGHERERRAFPLIGMLGGPAVAALKILDESNAAGYFARSDAFDMVLDQIGRASCRERV